MMDAHKAPAAMGAAIESPVTRDDMGKYRALAIELGASDAAVIPASDVVVDERVRLKCLVPRCLRAGETPNCPPNAPDLDLVRRAFANYQWAVLFKCDVGPIEDYVPGSGKTREEKRRVLSFHSAGAQVVYELEKHAYADGHHLAMGFGGGSCKDYLCQGMVCQFLDSGRCRFPQRARPAMEAVGIDVTRLINHVGWSLYPLVGDLGAIPCAITVGMVFIC